MRSVSEESDELLTTSCVGTTERERERVRVSVGESAGNERYDVAVCE